MPVYCIPLPHRMQVQTLSSVFWVRRLQLLEAPEWTGASSFNSSAYELLHAARAVSQGASGADNV